MPHLGAIMAPLGAIMAHLGRDLMLSWPQLRSSCAHLRPNFARRSHQSAPKIRKNRTKSARDPSSLRFALIFDPPGLIFHNFFPRSKSQINSRTQWTFSSSPDYNADMHVRTVNGCASTLRQKNAMWRLIGRLYRQLVGGSGALLGFTMISGLPACRDDLAHV